MAAKKSKLNIQLSEEDQTLMGVWADMNGVTVPEYIRKTLIESIPHTLREKLSMTEKNTNALDRAFDYVDEAENDGNGGSPGVMSLPPARKAIPGAVMEADRTHPMQRTVRVLPIARGNVPPGPHPCQHLSLTVPGHLQGQCQGQCEHREQRGRICYWTPTSARECPKFEAKMNPAPHARAR